MLTMQEVEMLAGLVMRAGVNQIEAMWANAILDRLRVLALEAQPGPPLEQPIAEERDG